MSCEKSCCYNHGRGCTSLISVETLDGCLCYAEGSLVYVKDENAFYQMQYGQLVKKVDILESSGIKGDKGDKGDAGEKGDKGEPGEAGLPGKSAFEIAVENGFAGTEADWLESLKCQCDCGGGSTDPEPGEYGDLLVVDFENNVNMDLVSPRAYRGSTEYVAGADNGLLLRANGSSHCSAGFDIKYDLPYQQSLLTGSVLKCVVEATASGTWYSSGCFSSLHIISDRDVTRDSTYGYVATGGHAAFISVGQNHSLYAILNANSGKRLRFEGIINNDGQIPSVRQSRIIRLSDMAVLNEYSTTSTDVQGYTDGKPHIPEFFITNYANNGLLKVHKFTLGYEPAIAFDTSRVLSWEGQLP